MVWQFLTSCGGPGRPAGFRVRPGKWMDRSEPVDGVRGCGRGWVLKVRSHPLRERAGGLGWRGLQRRCRLEGSDGRPPDRWAFVWA